MTLQPIQKYKPKEYVETPHTSKENFIIGNIQNIENIENIEHIGQKTFNIIQEQQPQSSLSSPRQQDIQPEEQREQQPQPLHENEIIDEFDISPPSADDRYKFNNIDISELFYQFQLSVKNYLTSSQTPSLQLESHLQHILSLSSILLLKPNRFHDDLKKIIDQGILENIVTDINKQLNLNMNEFDNSIIIKLFSIFKNIRKNELDRMVAAMEVMKLMEQTKDHMSKKILISVRNLIENLPMKNLDEDIKEIELITRYVHPLLSPLLDDITNNIMFRWTSTTNQEWKTSFSISKRRPDSNITETNGTFYDKSFGFGEVKCKSMALNHYATNKDLLRIAHFSKNSIDTHSINSVLSFTVVGDYITFYIMMLKSDGLYVMLEIGHIKIPMSVYEIPTYIAHLDELLDVLHVYYNTILNQPIQPTSTNNRKRKTITTPQFDKIVDKTKDKKRKSISSHYNH
ncbi:hypothetical protein BJ944DRAFT_226692 [Cunninghamella echinulata]|nr:hypothetical protein BJ944DRAFT_226692 [Cunninghamella echinulata]